MKLAISNLAWNADIEDNVLELMKRFGFSGLEIAPTKIFPEQPYDRCDDARIWADKLFREHGVEVCSMQSIWFGRKEKMFPDADERKILLDYTKRAIIFAQSVGAKNLVFGCPKSRCVESESDEALAKEFFAELGNFAFEHDTVLSIEPNPPIYGTNYINTTEQAFALVDAISSEGLKINIDMGTIIANEESCDMLAGRVGSINHVHISEPFLKLIERRELHEQLAGVLRNERYDRYVSIEMSNCASLSQLEDTLRYVSDVFLK